MAKVAIIVDKMFEDSEFRVPCERLKESGHEVEIVGLEAGKQLEIGAGPGVLAHLEQHAAPVAQRGGVAGRNLERRVEIAERALEIAVHITAESALVQRPG